MFQKNKQVNVLWIRLALIINLGLFFWLFFLKEDLVIKNYQSSVEFPVHTAYHEDNLNICYGTLFNCQTLDYEKDGEVDPDKLGDYLINYYYQYNNEQHSLSKTVHVVDKEKPVITVEDEIKACGNGKILSNNYQATDNYDGDLTKEVKYIKEDNVDYLMVTDTSGNTTKITASVRVLDEEAPKITLKGGKAYLLIGQAYKEAGFSALDNCDGDVTKLVVVTNNINNKKVGNYQVTYQVSDTSGNINKVTRDVVVIRKNQVIAPTNKTIYLTFDDGPCAYTGKLLQTLDRYNVKATFFVTNQFPNYQKYIREAYQKGHSIGIHTYSHQFSIYRSVDTYFTDLNKMNAIIKKQTGKESRLVRFPGGSSNTISRKYNKGIMKVLANELESRGYSYFDWDLASGDSDGLTTKSQVVSHVIKNLNNKTRMILMHDIKSYSVDAVADIIEYGLSHGYNFQAINLNSPTYHHHINN